MTTPRYDPHRHHRRSIRLPNWDYKTQAFYFVTICTHNRETLFTSGSPADIAAIMWPLIPRMPCGRDVILDEWVLMPNHLHGLLLLLGPVTNPKPDDMDATIVPGLPFDMRYASPPAPSPQPGGRPKPQARSLGTIIGTYKSGVTRRINSWRGMPGGRVWQRGYYERIVRDHHELQRIQQYIRDNPTRWTEDRENLDAMLERMTYING